MLTKRDAIASGLGLVAGVSCMLLRPAQVKTEVKYVSKREEVDSVTTKEAAKVTVIEKTYEAGPMGSKTCPVVSERITISEQPKEVKDYARTREVESHTITSTKQSSYSIGFSCTVLGCMDVARYDVSLSARLGDSPFKVRATNPLTSINPSIGIDFEF